MSQENTNYAVSFTMREGGMGAEERLAAVQEFLRKWVEEREAERSASMKAEPLVLGEKFTRSLTRRVLGASLSTHIYITLSTVSWVMTYRRNVVASEGLVSEQTVGLNCLLEDNVLVVWLKDMTIAKTDFMLVNNAVPPPRVSLYNPLDPLTFLKAFPGSRITMGSTDVTDALTAPVVINRLVDAQDLREFNWSKSRKFPIAIFVGLVGYHRTAAEAFCRMLHGKGIVYLVDTSLRKELEGILPDGKDFVFRLPYSVIPSVGSQLALKLAVGKEWTEPIALILRACYADVIFDKMTIKSFEDLQFLKRRSASMWMDRWVSAHYQGPEIDFVRRKIYTSSGWKPKDVDILEDDSVLD